MTMAEDDEKCSECGHIRAGKKSGDMCMYPFQDEGPCTHRCQWPDALRHRHCTADGKHSPECVIEQLQNK